jgi:hypothetical protein
MFADGDEEELSEEALERCRAIWVVRALEEEILWDASVGLEGKPRASSDLLGEIEAIEARMKGRAAHNIGGKEDLSGSLSRLWLWLWQLGFS